MANTAPQGSITDLKKRSYTFSSSVASQVGIIMLNPDGSSILGGSGPVTNTAPQGSITDLERQVHIMSTAVPGQIGIVGLNPDQSNL